MGTSANIIVRLGDADISVKDLMQLEPGDIIQLNNDATMPLEVLVEGMPKFRGVPGLLKGSRAIKITESLIEM